MQVDELREIARHAYDRELSKQNLKVAMTSRLYVSYNGGSFTVTRELMSFLQLWGDTKIYILDDYDTPIDVIADKLLVLCMARYQEIMNEWHKQYEQQSKIRTAKNF